jgi:hypothetical protein
MGRPWKQDWRTRTHRIRAARIFSTTQRNRPRFYTALVNAKQGQPQVTSAGELLSGNRSSRFCLSPSRPPPFATAYSRANPLRRTPGGERDRPHSPDNLRSVGPWRDTGGNARRHPALIGSGEIAIANGFPGVTKNDEFQRTNSHCPSREPLFRGNGRRFRSCGNSRLRARAAVLIGCSDALLRLWERPRYQG